MAGNPPGSVGGESVHDDLIDPVGVVTRTAAILDPFSGMWVVMAGPAGSLQNDNVADIKVNTSIGPQDILQAGMSCPHEWAQQIAIAIEPGVKEIWHGQDDMSVCYTGYIPTVGLPITMSPLDHFR